MPGIAGGRLELTPVLASIPSPSNGTIDIGPLSLHAYGLMLAIGVLAAVKVAEVRWRRQGHDGRDITDMAIWVVIAGVIGARLYHVITDYQLYTHDWIKAFEIWTGGLAIWGAVAGGALAVFLVARRRRLDALALMDAIAPGVVLAQAIGRWGNYFNQELFGKPTTLPWGLEISPAHRPAGYEQYATFHPTFLYESLACLAIFVVLVRVGPRLRLRRGQTTAAYIALYTLARFFFENLRIDPAHHVAGLRINAWVSLGVCVAAVAWFVWLGRRADRPSAATDVDGSDPDRSAAGPDSGDGGVGDPAPAASHPAADHALDPAPARPGAPSAP